MIEFANINDGEDILKITKTIGVFNKNEINCVTEIWEEYCRKGAKESGYHFVSFRDDGKIKGYACYGPRSLTAGTYDLYWIAVDPTYRRSGIGLALLSEVEKDVSHLGGWLIMVETSGKEDYLSARQFYKTAGYQSVVTIRDFYAIGDDLVLFTKYLPIVEK